MQKSLLLATATLYFLVHSTAQAQIGEIIGYAKELHSIINGLIGTTTVTPAYALNTWRWDRWGYYWSFPFNMHWYVSRDPVLGTCFYTHAEQDANGSWNVSNSPFFS
jgi:hypothetical protein